MSAAQPKISVVLPVRFVNENWLRQSIESILNQDYPNKELIVVNDEATKPIDDLVASYGIEKYVKNDRNRKLPYSLNRGFERADGEFHTWTSADNYMLPGMLSRLCAELVRRPEIGIVFHKYVILGDDGQAFDTEPAYDQLDQLTRSSRRQPDVPAEYTYFSTLGASFLYRKEVWQNMHGYDEELHGAEDYDFWVRASRNFRIGRLPWDEAPLYVYRTHGNSMSNTVGGAFSAMRVEVLERETSLHPRDKDLRRAFAILRRRLRSNAIRQSVRTWLGPVKALIRGAR